MLKPTSATNYQEAGERRWVAKPNRDE